MPLPLVLGTLLGSSNTSCLNAFWCFSPAPSLSSSSAHLLVAPLSCPWNLLAVWWHWGYPYKQDFKHSFTQTGTEASSRSSCTAINWYPFALQSLFLNSTSWGAGKACGKARSLTVLGVQLALWRLYCQLLSLLVKDLVYSVFFKKPSISPEWTINEIPFLFHTK